MRSRHLKLLLVGPCPPPHGGISVHVATLCKLLRRDGVTCEVLNTERDRASGCRGPAARAALGRIARLAWYAAAGWTVHVHTNGHNPKSWMIAVAGGLAGRAGGGALLTLHSGMAPAYIRGCRGWRRWLTRAGCRLHHSIICVNHDIAAAVRELGMPAARTTVRPAYLPAVPADARIPADLDAWLAARDPILTATLFFRPNLRELP